jgi:hypothetical protein
VTGVRVHRLRVALLDVGPPTVWRRVHVPSAATLGVLHQVVQAVMGWQGHHLHAFTAAWGRRSDADTPDTETVALAAVLPKVGDRLVYVYDFGDHWEHLIEVEQVHRPAPRIRYPRCPAGAGACPPEDCGGPPGYHDLQRALRSRKGPRTRVRVTNRKVALCSGSVRCDRLAGPGWWVRAPTHYDHGNGQALPAYGGSPDTGRRGPLAWHAGGPPLCVYSALARERRYRACRPAGGGTPPPSMAVGGAPRSR